MLLEQVNYMLACKPIWELAHRLQNEINFKQFVCFYVGLP
jgi:hypothetical protein